MDNFSRGVLAREIYQAQDLASVLIVLSLIQCYVRATEIEVLLQTFGEKQAQHFLENTGPVSKQPVCLSP
jgi:hypothetical protein